MLGGTTTESIVNVLNWGHQNRLESETAEYEYDKNGNQISKTTFVTGDSGGSEEVGIYALGSKLPMPREDYTVEINEYNVFNQLVKVQNDEGTSIYVYKADGLRIGTTKTEIMGSTGSEDVISEFIWDGTNIVAEIADGEMATYLRGINLISADKNGAKSYYLFNAHGDVVQMANSSGGLIKSYQYDSFGIEINPDPDDDNIWRFAGEMFVKETGDYYMRARVYDPSTGIFTSEDPVRDGLNWYTYCMGNPIAFVDPNGLAPESAAEALRRQTNGWTPNTTAVIPYQYETLEQELDDWDRLWTAMGIDTAAVGAAFLDMEFINGSYHAVVDAWQQNAGYNWTYDMFFDMGTSMEARYFEFSYDNQDFRFWAWKGDYINLGAGAELGLYKRNINLYSLQQSDAWAVDKAYALPMTMTLSHTDGTLLAWYFPDDPQWWITSFNPNFKDIDPSNLRATFSVYFKDNIGMYNAFYDKYGQGEYKNDLWTFDPYNYIATLKF